MSDNYNFLKGEKLYQERARLALPYLVRQAKAGKTIYYSELAKEIGMPNPRNLNKVLSEIGEALISLGKATKRKIPPIQSLVINKNSQLPGDGFSEFVDNYNKLNRKGKEQLLDRLSNDIYIYQDWDWVSEQFNLEPIIIDLTAELNKARNWKSSGESEHHKQFKEFLSKNPVALGLGVHINAGITEHLFPSADAIDVLFMDKNLKIGVEAKSKISDKADILRGLYQCVKYKSLIEAEQIVENKDPNSRVILALQGKFPEELNIVKNLLGIEVIDSIKIN